MSYTYVIIIIIIYLYLFLDRRIILFYNNIRR